MDIPNLMELAYLVSASLFILGLKGLTKPKTAVRGNMLGAIAMLIAVVVTLLAQKVVSYEYIAIGVALGAVIGVVVATKVQMTSMPEMVALFNGFGGIASVLVAGAYLLNPDSTGTDVMVATALSGMIGAVTFSGSLVAWGKLQEFKRLEEIKIPAQNLINLFLVLACLSMAAIIIKGGDFVNVAYWFVALTGLILGFTLVVSIGGADMPVVIALLNSCSGLAAAATGFVLSNTVLIIAGSLVGASGLILTRIMCVAMNRSLFNVLFGTMGQTVGDAPDAEEVYKNVKSTSAEEVAMLLEVAGRVVIVPGYGMAVAQAQHAVNDLRKLLVSKQIEVDFAIHPVAGRMPGHMNVLLAEADVPYESLHEMDKINPTLDTVDVAIVLGANDVVNPLARTDPNSPIAGMPIIDVDKARTVIVIKRSLSPGFAKIPNPLFALDQTLMFYGDGRKAIQEIIAALNE
jgi:NAD(P) transhydrogenase subunit beta